MITSLHLENFRCFHDFFLENTSQLTLIGGKNNVGKTSLLEAIFLLFACGNPDVFVKMNMIRGSLLTVFSPDITWEHLFYKKGVDNAMSISAKDNDEELFVKFQREQSTTFSMPIISANRKLSMLQNGYPLKITCKYSKEITHTGYCLPLQEGMTMNWDMPPQNNSLPIVSYIGIDGGNQQNLAIQFGNLVKSGKKQEVIDTLRLLEPELIDISTVAEEIPRLYIQKKDRPLLPLSVMGNGICRLAKIIFSILEYPKGILLVDEVESGFHYSFLEKFWETIEYLANMVKVQIFATTHSYECARSALSSLEDKHKFSYIRLNNENGDVVPYIFPPDAFRYSIEHSIEIR